jgi:hypothetical protein
MDAYDITVEVYKTDRRQKSGERLVLKKDHMVNEKSILKQTYKTTYPQSKGYRIEFHDTYVTRKNIMTGQNVIERYDTPYFCSPSSESFWSM